MVSFLDFLDGIAALSDVYRLIVPCRVESDAVDEEWAPVHLSREAIEVRYYEGNIQATVVSFLNAIRVRAMVRDALGENKEVTVAGPGPNSFMFWLSLMVPRTVRFVYFIRGDTLETVRHIYRGHILPRITRGLVRLYRYRINYLLRKERAVVFTFGEKLMAQYQHSRVYAIIPLIHASLIRKDARPGIGDGLLKILYVGRFSKEKNVLALIDAVKIAVEQGARIVLSIVGFGPLENDIRDRIEDMGVSKCVTLRGYVPYGDSLVAEYDRHDVFCLPSRTESIGGVVIEAFARGMPVVATKVGSLPVYFPDAIKFVDGYEPRAIANALKWCDENRAQLSAMGRKGWATIDRFLISENAKKVHSIVQESFCNT